MPLIGKGAGRSLLYTPPVAAAGGLGLQTNLTSFWSLSESSGTRADSVVASANDLADNNTVTGGNDGVAYSQFTRANSEYLSLADNASLSLGNISFSASAWFYMDSVNAEIIAGKRGGFGQSEWDLRRTFTSSHVMQFRIFNSSNTAEVAEVAAPSTGAWHFVCVTCNVSGNIAIAIDNGTPVTTAKTITIQDGNGPFQIGGANGAAEFFDGRIRRVGFWKNRILSAGDQTALYNSGSGLDYAAMA